MNEIRKNLFLAAPVERVWAYLTDRDKLQAWLMGSDIVNPGEGTRFAFTAEPSGRWDGRIDCEIRQFIEYERIAYTWSANDIGVETLVTFDLEAVTGGTRLTLTHAGFEGAVAGSAGRHAAGWHNALKSLRATIEGPDESYDWSEFAITYYVDAPVPDVHALWSTAAGMQRFWADHVIAKSADDRVRGDDETFRHGDRLDLRFPTGTDTTLEILNIEQDKFVLFSFGEDYGWVRVTLAAEGARTRIMLRQFGMPTGADDPWEVHANARGWWVANLINIKSVLLHDNDLRVRDPDTSSGLGAGFAPGGTAPAHHDWRSFDVYLQIDAEPRAVMDVWRTTSGITSFFVADMRAKTQSGAARAEGELIEPGDGYCWQYVHDYAGEGRFVASTDELVKFTFGTEFEVEVTAEASGNGSLLHLHQSGIDDSPDGRVYSSLNCRCCWIAFLVNLKSIAEHGIDLRDHQPETADSISVGFNR